MNEMPPQPNELPFSAVEGVFAETVEVIDTVVRVKARTTARQAPGRDGGVLVGANSRLLPAVSS
ncbi:hypothetical protein [Streptomyces lincolnensis]|uniref:hypothetical protein n=1 Tax=Streptomyces lincolnensis TaxID=1915 RepID=UPI0037CDF966